MIHNDLWVNQWRTLALECVQAALRRGGVALHAIHLEDHLDFRRNPLAFFSADTDWRERDADARGNRLRASDWLRIFRSLPAAQVEILWEVVREDAPLPRSLDSAFAGYAERDLRIGGIMLAVRSDSVRSQHQTAN
jgi:hypothetical protein